jgi:hypothetical protein
VLQQVPPDPLRYDPEHLLTYAELNVYLKFRYNITIPLSSLYSDKNRGTGPLPTKFRGTKFRVRDVDAWVANGGKR